MSERLGEEAGRVGTGTAVAVAVVKEEGLVVGTTDDADDVDDEEEEEEGEETEVSLRTSASHIPQ